MRRIAESELIINGDGSVFHLHILPEDLADTVILVGDQNRVPAVAKYFDEGSVVCDKSSREFHTITGKYHGKDISVMSTGIGTDNIDIVMNELDALVNVDFTTRQQKPQRKSLNILRIGTCGCVRPDIPLGGFVLSEVGIGIDGLLNWYEGGEKASDSDMEKAFMEHMGWAPRLATPYCVWSSKEILDRFDGCARGITMSAPGFYGPQGRSIRMGLTIPDFIPKLEQFEFRGVRMTNIEMENSAIVGIANLLGHHAATICCAIANRFRLESIPDYKPYIEKLIVYALDSLTA
ncbi:MAG: nucleoside phosphorylase [Bacteroidales bacterium]|jgi:uridine phosphorylase|nr:nucleoside phosphorylase [Bacteroidales bacterium]